MRTVKKNDRQMVTMEMARLAPSTKRALPTLLGHPPLVIRVLELEAGNQELWVGLLSRSLH